MKLEFFGMLRIGKLKIKTNNTYKLLSQFVEEIVKQDKFTCQKLRGRKRHIEYVIIEKLFS